MQTRRTQSALKLVIAIVVGSNILNALNSVYIRNLTSLARDQSGVMCFDGASVFCSVAVMSYVVLVFTRLYGLGGPLEIIQQCVFLKVFLYYFSCSPKEVRLFT